jgi:ABC-type antimicrobial peptide transport system permease subunit
LLSEFIENLIPCLTEELFILRKNYTVKQEMEHTFGKWPDFLGNSYFIESKWLVPDLIDMFKEKLDQFLLPESFDSRQKDISAYDELFDLFRAGFDPEKISDYSFFVMGKMQNREEEYIYGPPLHLLRLVNNY